MEVYYTDHLKLRLRIRKVPEEYRKIIYKNPDQKFFDNMENTNIEIKGLNIEKFLSLFELLDTQEATTP